MRLDPYRTLGVPPGASAAEIKRAYRQLVKEHHPDSGGPAELPRFLEIQAAYEVLTSDRAPGHGAAGAGFRGSSSSAAHQPWRADPARARATRDAWRRQGARGQGTGAPGAAGGARHDAGAPGAEGPAGGSAGAAETGHGRAGAGHGRAAGGAETSGPAWATGGAPGGATGDGTRDRTRHRRDHHRPPKARPGSTTYDGADREPAEPDWSGSSWYGQASGTYWTINPKEYADPRKHGPAYLARARRAAMDAAAAGMPPGGGGADGSTGRPAAEAAPASAAADAAPSGPRGDGGASVRQPNPAPADRGPRPGPAAGPGEPPGERLRPQPRERPTGTRRRAGTTGASAAAGPAGARAAAGPAGSTSGATTRPSATPSAGLGTGAPDGLREVVDRILRMPVRGRARLALAIAAWPPLGLAMAILIGELSGCARFAASCAGTGSFATWVLAAQLAVVAAMLAIPSLARVGAFGTLAAVLAALPLVAFLTAVGGPYDPRAGPASLLTLLAASWILGAALGTRAMLREAGGRPRG